MPARNIYHDAVVRALTADGWTITDDPYRVEYGGHAIYVDLAAERASLAAEKDGRKIAVEIQSFLSNSVVDDMHRAVGQYDVYRAILVKTGAGRELYMAVPSRVYEEFLSEKFGQAVVQYVGIKYIVFDDAAGRIKLWIESSATATS